MSFASSALIGHGLMLTLFAVYGLMLNPAKILGAYGRDNGPVLRICGLWVACAGMVSCYVGNYLESEHQQAACWLLMVVHFIEVGLKFQAGRPKNAVGNTILGVLLLAAIVVG